jgi:putative peptide zinc metalloprotease protein
MSNENPPKPPGPQSPPGTPPQKFWLRKLRHGVTLHFSGYDLEGVPHWQLYDGARNNFFVIGWPEFEMLSRWNLGDGQAIVDAVNKETTIHVELQDFEDLRTFLYNNFLVEHRWRNVYQKAKENKLIKGENLFYWFLRYYLFFRIPLFRPDKFLDRTKFFGEFLFSKVLAYIMICLGIIAIYQIGIRWEEFVHTFSSIFNWQGLFLYLIAFSIAKLFHELGHAYMCKKYGVPVPTIGVAFLVFWPVLYTDTTLSWSLPSHQRVRIALAGMWVETYITIIAALIWCNIHSVTLQMICYITVAINWVGTLLINLSPFMRFDGYYVASDLLKMPNLQGRSFELARWQIRNWLFGWEEPMHEPFSPKMHRLLVTYAILTWTYRLVIYFGIALLVYHYFFKVIGIILFAIEIFAFILRPIALELRRWYELRHQFTLNSHTKITLTCAMLIALLLLLPLNGHIKLDATLGYEHEFLYAPGEAILQKPLPPTNMVVKAKQPLVELKSPEIDYNLEKAKLEYEAVVIEARRASLDPKYTNQLHNLMANQAEKKAEYEKWLDSQNRFTLKSPFNGKIGDIASGLEPGVVLMKNEWILDVVNPERIIVEAYVEELDVDTLKIGTEGKFYPTNLDLPIVPVRVYAVEPLNTAFLAAQFSKDLKQNSKKEFVVNTPIYHVSELGGKIPAELTEEGKYAPIESIFRVLLVPLEPVAVHNIQLGTVVLTVKPRSYIYRSFHKIKNVILKESAF